MKLGHKRPFLPSVFITVPWISHSGGSQQLHLEDAQGAYRKVYLAKKWSLQLRTIWANNLGRDPPAEVGPLEDTLQLTSWLQPHKPWARTAQLSQYQIPHLWKLGKQMFLDLITAAAAKSLQSCPTLCDPTDGNPSGSTIPRILQARTLERVAISFSQCRKVKSESEVAQSCLTLSLFFFFVFYCMQRRQGDKVADNDHITARQLERHF